MIYGIDMKQKRLNNYREGIRTGSGRRVFYPRRAVFFVPLLMAVIMITGVPAGAGAAKSGGAYSIDTDVAGNAAGGVSAGGAYSVTTSAAQPAGYAYSAGGSYVLNGGLLAVLCSASTPPQIPQAITINTGWNLAGVSETGVVFDPSSVFSTGTYEIVSYDGDYQFHTSGNPINMQLCDTYWIYGESDLGEIPDDGAELTEDTYQVNLDSGWVSFSLPFNDRLIWGDAAAALDCGGAASLPPVYSYIDGEGYTKITPNTGLYLLPWTGYWLKLEQSCSLTFSR